jgi:hypothetical protein
VSVPKIVACVDGSDTSEQVLPLAAAWARALGMSLTNLARRRRRASAVGPDWREGSYGSAGDAESYIATLVRKWHAVAPAVDGEVVPDAIGSASGVGAHLDQRLAGLLAVTTHARSGVQRALSGVAAAGILHASVVPCLVAPVS